MKRMEFLLSSTWKLHFGRGQRIRKKEREEMIVTDRQEWNLLRNEMMHFVTHFQYYLMFEVVECSWKELVENMNQAQDLDQLIRAHNKYIADLFKNSFLTSQDMLKIQSKALTLIQKFCQLQEKLALGSEETIQFKQLSLQETAKVISYLSTLSDEFAKVMLELLAFLNTQSSENLQSMKTRLDFSEYYEHQRKKPPSTE